MYLRKFITSQQPQRIFRETVGQISSDSSDEEVKMAARRVTKSLFRSLRRPGQRVLTAGDLERVLTPSIAAKAFEILSLVKGAREISFDTCLAALTDIFNEHRVLERALRDSKTMVGALR